ncbi:putative eukaryotic translation initiation factor 4 gamma [Leptomonas pyrrhocoris]|uniref:Putative eukaryotic translation initiation factor 4 gamma n=1 Tax=Leptomonas pyrrhocoris TaxID=157538 RepID=A0A0N0DST1_LEPPY|nr:putative eukaryotic translation initiation factor 4 gamma [Leptomonas pyrrhocoris]XP_015654494.1 putative eukaryotic translation initiation factor 4 gamma [Leptomonas pyrrhocoris]KPA76054.1 putative eukaryotic translation initiation factor 4 gamma [Leptomonas pyrrhocoris]KPA76055.1 putative eukaryotic translation initiation factor 4 gamma [Leptomonas pyrrhocoris]|eukprot:XP_015654493.1 putative eukaryotic translation initiation factor 4 gamma [Leptomonas pyrrhocoris]
MVSRSFYPGRTTSAPLAPPARGMPSFRTATERPTASPPAGGVLPHHHSGLPRAPLPRQPASPAPPPPEEKEEKKNSSKDVAPVDVPYPEDHIYNVEDFIKLRRCVAMVPVAVMEYARAMWREMPENMDDMENNSLRDNLFREQNAAMISKVMVDRKIQNEVLGILGKVTVSNLDKMKQELIELPIRQSTDDEINEVIKVFFNKSTKPEDSCFTDLYVQLIAHLISTIGEKEQAGRTIRKEVLRQCQSTFMNSNVKQAEMEANSAQLTPEEAEFERLQFSGKQKANIHFLGLMFTNGLVHPRVVRAVLDSLLYGGGQRRHVPTDYNLIHFMELLQVCGPHLDKAFYEDPLPRYIETITDLSRTHPQKRIQFLLLNFMEMMNNNWVPLHGPTAPRGADGSPEPASNSSHRGANGRSTNASPIVPIPMPIPEAQPKIPDYEEFSKVMDDFFVSSSVDEIVLLMGSIPPESVVAYCTKWLGRYINTYKYTAERTRLGELFETLMKKNAMTVEQAQEALLQHVQKSADEELFADIPKYFVHWASLIKHGHSVFPYSLHTRVLNMLVESHVDMKVIATMVRHVEAESKPEQLKDLKPQDRFRVLQAVLRYTPPLFTDRSNIDPQAPLILELVGVEDPEVAYFVELCQSYDANELHSNPKLSDMQKQSPVLAASAFFTFVRYDVNYLCTQYKEILRKIFTARPADSLLVEVYLQWKTLDCSHRFLFAFVRKVLDVVNNRMDVLNKLLTQLRTTYKEEQLVSLLEEAIKERK